MLNLSSLDHLMLATRAAQRGGLVEVSRHFYTEMDKAARIQFDTWLERMGDPRALDPGPSIIRFMSKVQEVLDRISK